MSDEFICTSILEYAEHLEGQVFCRGSRDECEATCDAISAIAITGGIASPISSRLFVCLAGYFPGLGVGERWRMAKPAKPAEPKGE